VWYSCFEIVFKALHLLLQIFDLELQVLDVLLCVVEIIGIHPSWVVVVPFVIVVL
jgi:hypothetical protein